VLDGLLGMDGRWGIDTDQAASAAGRTGSTKKR
jgi:hypothetical protein